MFRTNAESRRLYYVLNPTSWSFTPFERNIHFLEKQIKDFFRGQLSAVVKKAKKKKKTKGGVGRGKKDRYVAPGILGEIELVPQVGGELWIFWNYYFDEYVLSSSQYEFFHENLIKGVLFLQKFLKCKIRLYPNNYFTATLVCRVFGSKERKMKRDARASVRTFPQVAGIRSTAKRGWHWMSRVWRCVRRYRRNAFFQRVFTAVISMFIFKFDSFLLARVISLELETLRKRHKYFLSFLKKVIKNCFRVFGRFYLKGLEIRIKGRLTSYRRQVRRTQKTFFRFGFVKRSLLKHYVSHGSKTAFNRYGSISVQVSANFRFYTLFRDNYGVLKTWPRFSLTPRESETLQSEKPELYFFLKRSSAYDRRDMTFIKIASRFHRRLQPLVKSQNTQMLQDFANYWGGGATPFPRDFERSAEVAADKARNMHQLNLFFLMKRFELFKLNYSNNLYHPFRKSGYTFSQEGIATHELGDRLLYHWEPSKFVHSDLDASKAVYSRMSTTSKRFNHLGNFIALRLWALFKIFKKKRWKDYYYRQEMVSRRNRQWALEKAKRRKQGFLQRKANWARHSKVRRVKRLLRKGLAILFSRVKRVKPFFRGALLRRKWFLGKLKKKIFFATAKKKDEKTLKPKTFKTQAAKTKVSLRKQKGRTLRFFSLKNYKSFQLLYTRILHCMQRLSKLPTDGLAKQTLKKLEEKKRYLRRALRLILKSKKIWVPGKKKKKKKGKETLLPFFTKEGKEGKEGSVSSLKFKKKRKKTKKIKRRYRGLSKVLRFFSKGKRFLKTFSKSQKNLLKKWSRRHRQDREHFFKLKKLWTTKFYQKRFNRRRVNRVRRTLGHLLMKKKFQEFSFPSRRSTRTIVGRAPSFFYKQWKQKIRVPFTFLLPRQRPVRIFKESLPKRLSSYLLYFKSFPILNYFLKLRSKKKLERKRIKKDSRKLFRTTLTSPLLFIPKDCRYVTAFNKNNQNNRRFHNSKSNLRNWNSNRNARSATVPSASKNFSRGNWDNPRGNRNNPSGNWDNHRGNRNNPSGNWDNHRGNRNNPSGNLDNHRGNRNNLSGNLDNHRGNQNLPRETRDSDRGAKVAAASKNSPSTPLSPFKPKRSFPKKKKRVKQLGRNDKRKKRREMKKWFSILILLNRIVAYVSEKGGFLKKHNPRFYKKFFLTFLFKKLALVIFRLFFWEKTEVNQLLPLKKDTKGQKRILSADPSKNIASPSASAVANLSKIFINYCSRPPKFKTLYSARLYANSTFTLRSRWERFFGGIKKRGSFKRSKVKLTGKRSVRKLALLKFRKKSQRNNKKLLRGFFTFILNNTSSLKVFKRLNWRFKAYKEFINLCLKEEKFKPLSSAEEKRRNFLLNTFSKRKTYKVFTRVMNAFKEIISLKKGVKNQESMSKEAGKERVLFKDLKETQGRSSKIPSKEPSGAKYQKKTTSLKRKRWTTSKKRKITLKPHVFFTPGGIFKKIPLFYVENSKVAFFQLWSGLKKEWVNPKRWRLHKEIRSQIRQERRDKIRRERFWNKNYYLLLKKYLKWIKRYVRRMQIKWRFKKRVLWKKFKRNRRRGAVRKYLPSQKLGSLKEKIRPTLYFLHLKGELLALSKLLLKVKKKENFKVLKKKWSFLWKKYYVLGRLLREQTRISYSPFVDFFAKANYDSLTNPRWRALMVKQTLTPLSPSEKSLLYLWPLLKLTNLFKSLKERFIFRGKTVGFVRKGRRYRGSFGLYKAKGYALGLRRIRRYRRTMLPTRGLSAYPYFPIYSRMSSFAFRKTLRSYFILRLYALYKRYFLFEQRLSFYKHNLFDSSKLQQFPQGKSLKLRESPKAKRFNQALLRCKVILCLGKCINEKRRIESFLFRKDIHMEDLKLILTSFTRRLSSQSQMTFWKKRLRPLTRDNKFLFLWSPLKKHLKDNFFKNRLELTPSNFPNLWAAWKKQLKERFLKKAFFRDLQKGKFKNRIRLSSDSKAILPKGASLLLWAAKKNQWEVSHFFYK